MKKTAFLLAAAVAVCLMALPASAAGRWNSGGCRGVCSYLDAGGDGVCDNPGSGRGAGHADADGDGVCDNFGSGGGPGSGGSGNGPGYRGGRS